MQRTLFRSVLPALFLCILGVPLAAQVRHIVLDKSPAYLFADSSKGRIHVLTAGSDANFNGILDPGEAHPRWFVIDAATERVIDSVTFGGLFNSYPVRPGVDLLNRRLYLPINGRLDVYDLDLMTLLTSGLPNNFSASSFDPLSNYLNLSIRAADFVSTGSMTVFDPRIGQEIASIETGVNPGMTVSHLDPTIFSVAYFTLNEGAFGQGNGSISYMVLNPDIYRSINGGNIGAGGRAMLRRDGRVFVAFDGTGQIRVLDAETHAELPPSPIAVGATGEDGPTALELESDSVLIVGTRAADVRRFNLRTGEEIDRITVPGHVAALAVRGSSLFVAISGGPGLFSDSLVAVVDLKSGTVVDTLDVGLDPGTLFVDVRGDLNVLGYGVDGKAPWWRVFDGTTLEQKEARLLPGALDLFGIPLGVAYDRVRDSLYVVLSDSVRAFSASNFTDGGRVLYGDRYIVSTYDGGDYLLVAEIIPGTGIPEAWLQMIRKTDGHLVARFRVGEGSVIATPVVSPHDSVTAVYAIARGTGNSAVALFEYAPNLFGNLGDGANHIYNADAGMIVTMNGAHEVVTINHENLEINRNVSTLTSGFDGPRESLLLNNDRLLVTTYVGDVRVMTVDGVVDSIPVGGKAEGIAALNDKVFVANAFVKDGYDPDSTVAVIDFNTLSVSREKTIADATTLGANVPNPVVDRTAIPFSLKSAAHVTLALYSADGRLIRTFLDEEMEPGEYTVEVQADGLPAGHYIYTLRDGGAIHSRMMQVVR